MNGPLPRDGSGQPSWPEIRRAYEAGESLSSLARRTGIDRKTIRRRGRAERWMPALRVGRNESDALSDVARARVVDLFSRRIVDDLESRGRLDEIVGVIEANLAAQMPLAAIATKIATIVLDRALEDLQQGTLSTADAALIGQRTADMVATTQRIAREAAGLRPGMPSIDAEEADLRGDILVTHQRLEPVRVPVDATGRALSEVV